jgi:hypothetical protein
MSRRKRMMEDLDQDICDFVERETQDNVERGMAPDEARYAALRKFGNLARVKEETREVWSINWFEQVWQDVCFGLRQLRRSPGFTAVAVLTLALSIGANTAIFSVAETTLLRSWPARAPERLVKIVAQTRDGEGTFSFAQYRDLCQQSRSLEEALAYSRHGPLLETETGSQAILTEYVSGNYFEVLGIPAALGRTFLTGSQNNSGERTVVISDRLWRRVFHGDPSLVGKAIVLNGGNFTVIGVAPRHVRGFEPDMPTEAWLLAATEGNDPSSSGSGDFELIGRMRSGTTATAVRAELETLGRRLAEEYPATDKGREIRVITERDRLRESLVPLMFVMGSVGLVLLFGSIEKRSASRREASPQILRGPHARAQL